MKFLISTKRKDSAKVEKDIFTAVQLTDFLLPIPDQQKLFIEVYDTMLKGWKKKLDPILEQHHPELRRLLITL